MTNAYDADLVERLYRSMRMIRRVEQEIGRLYPSDKIKSPVHLSIGQESVAVGICDALRKDDITTMTYRSHATYLAKGGDLNAMIAELYGKIDGCTQGKGGSMHLADMSAGVTGASAVVGTTIPMALGIAFSFKSEGSDRVATAFFGDGSTEEGVFSETMNFAALHKLPILFVMENNGYAIHSPVADRWAGDGICERIESYGIKTDRVLDGNVFDIRAAAEKGLAAIRSGDGPYFLECLTYRWTEHVGPGDDFNAGYRPQDEYEKWRQNDQIEILGDMLNAGARSSADAEIEDLIATAIEFAENSPFPKVAELWSNVYAS
jgi:TPP-dependent pyruvate/acetoin dehydrogenase alpha subunit